MSCRALSSGFIGEAGALPAQGLAFGVRRWGPRYRPSEVNAGFIVHRGFDRSYHALYFLRRQAENRHSGLTAIRPARLEPLALSASGHERVVNDRAAASGEKRMDLSEQIAWFGNRLDFGDILNMDGPLVETGSRSVFDNPVVGGRQSPAGEGLRTT